MGFPWFNNGSLLFYSDGQHSSLAERCCKANLHFEASGGGAYSGDELGDGTGSGVFIATRALTGGGIMFGSCGDESWSINSIDRPVTYAVRFYMMAWDGNEKVSLGDFTVGVAVTLTNKNGDTATASYSTTLAGSGTSKEHNTCKTPGDSLEIQFRIDPQCLSIDFSESVPEPPTP